MVTGATAVHVGASCLALLARRTPPLVVLAVQGSLGGPDGATSQAAFRDELVALARESAERSWHELRRGVDWLDAATRPSESSAAARPPEPAAGRRLHRVKP